ncbi:MAG: hypothetical protein K2Q33_09370, partial [Gammaproteobacteria bacterium]|nr:hypothetical protein [Gammaproteobacteria bacterium]
MVNSVKGPLDDVQDIYSEMPGDGVSHKAKNKRTAVFIVAVLTLLKEIAQKLINNEAVRAEMLKKLEAAIEEAQAADSSKAFWEKLRQGVLAEVERQLKALASQNKIADNLHAKVAVLGQHLDHLFKQVDAVSALAARFEEAHPAITAGITAIDTNLSVIERALEEAIAAPEELVTLSEQVTDIRKQYLGIQEKYQNWLNEFNNAVRELNMAASTVETTMTEIAASVGTSDSIASAAMDPSVALRPAVAPISAPSLEPVVPLAVPFVAPAVGMPAPEISERAVPRVVSRPAVTGAPTPKPSFVVDDSTQRLLNLLGVSTTLVEGSQQKLNLVESQLKALGLRIGAA